MRALTSLLTRFRLIDLIASLSLVAVTAVVAGCGRVGGTDARPPLTLEGKPLSGRVEMSEVQIAYLGSAGGGKGTLHFRGRSYPFTVGGLGVGGIGISTIDAAGEVYNLSAVAQFPGAYVEGRYGAAIGDYSTGELWLQNPNGVILHLKAKRTGLMLSLGADAVAITMER